MKIHSTTILKQCHLPTHVGMLPGFTTIEILGVLAIMSILVAAMIPAIMASFKRTERQNEEANLDAIATGR